MSDLESKIVGASIAILLALVARLWKSVRDIRRSLDHAGEALKMTDKIFSQRYWDSAHNITLLFDYLGVYVDEPQAARKLVKKGGPEKGP